MGTTSAVCRGCNCAFDLRVNLLPLTRSVANNRSSIYFLVQHILGLTSGSLALCRRFQRRCSAFNGMNAAAVFAPEKVYKCSGSVAFNCVPKLQFAAATRTRLTDAGRLHGVPPRLREVRRRNQIVPMKTRFARLFARRRYTATIHHTVVRKTIVTI
jgi:hypothetical protein